MGTWGIKPQENDGAADWLYDMREADDLFSFLQRTVQEGSEEEQVIAAEAILCSLGKDRGNLTEENIRKVQEASLSVDAVKDLAKQLVTQLQKILTSQDGILALWKEDGNDEGWEDDVKALKAELEELQ